MGQVPRSPDSCTTYVNEACLLEVTGRPSAKKTDVGLELSHTQDVVELKPKEIRVLNKHQPKSPIGTKPQAELGGNRRDAPSVRTIAKPRCWPSQELQRLQKQLDQACCVKSISSHASESGHSCVSRGSVAWLPACIDIITTIT